MAGESFFETENGLFPVRPLLKDPTQAQNALEAFLGGDCRKELPLSLAKSDNDLSAITSLCDWITQHVNILDETPDTFSAWFVLSAIQGDFPPSSDLVPQLSAIFRKVDYVTLLKKSTQLGYIAIQTVSMQCWNLHDEDLRQHLKGQVLKIARYLADLEASADSTNGMENWKKAPALLIEVALNIALAAESPFDTSEEFAQVLLQLAVTWKAIAPACRPIVQALVEELPVRQSHKLWSLLVWLRAN